MIQQTTTPDRITEGRTRTRWHGAFTVALLLAPIAIAAILAANFFYQARFDEGFRYYPYDWHAQWIASPYKDTKTACFRKTLFVPDQVRSAYLVLAADNFYELRVNNVIPNAFFRPGLTRTLVKDSTTYTALGYPRRIQLGRVYDLSRYLRPGRNVITVLVQADTQMPRLAAQGAITTSYRQEFVSDNSWKCAPYEKQTYSVPWESLYYSDAAWAHAASTGQPVRMLIDGDTALFDLPMQGYFVGAGTTQLISPAHFRRTVVFPGKVQDGWLRIASITPYDLFLNGRLIGSTSSIDRYARNLVGKRGEFDALGRIQFSNPAYQYPSVRPAASLDMFLLKNVFREGPNLLEVTLHTREVPQIRTIPTFYLDGRVTFADGSAQTVMTDSAWQAQTEGEDWKPARIASRPGFLYTGFARTRIRGKIDAGGGTYARTARNSLLFFGGLLGVSLCAAWVVRLLGAGRRAPWLQTMGALCIAPAALLVCGFVVQAVFISSPQDAYFSSPAFARLPLIAGGIAWIGSLALAILLARRKEGQSLSEPFVQGVEDFGARLPGSVMRYGVACAVGLIMFAAFAFFYTRSLGNDDYLPDEYVSILAARGILRHGIPVYEGSGIIYTRSSLFHYLLALFLATTGGVPTPLSTRLPAALWQLATIPLAYLFGREMKGRKAGLIAAAMAAFSPFMIYYAREARFYTQFAFFTTLTFYLLLKSVRNPDRNGYRAGAALAYCGAYLSQQFAFAMIPAILLVIMFSGQLRQWLRWRSLAWVGVALAVMGLDFYAYTRWCQTPLPFVDSEAVLPLALHTDILELLPSMLLSSNERSQAMLGLLFVGGLVYLIVRLFRAPDDAEDGQTGGWRWWNYLYLTSGLTILVTTLVSSRPANRYIVHMVPLVAVTAACVAVEFGQLLYRLTREATGTRLTARLTQGAYALAVGAICLAAYRPMRVWNTAERSNNRGTTAAARYVALHRKPGDKVMFFSPEIAMVELGDCDYMWRPRRGSIFKYIGPDGRMRERNSGAVVVDNSDKLRRVMVENQRVWFVIHPGSVGTPGLDVSGQMAKVLQDNFQVVYEPFSMQVMLWDRGLNHYRNSVRNNGFDQYNF